MRNFTSGKSAVYVLAAAAKRGFTMVLFTASRRTVSKVHALYRVPFEFAAVRRRRRCRVLVQTTVSSVTGKRFTTVVTKLSI